MEAEGWVRTYPNVFVVYLDKQNAVRAAVKYTYADVLTGDSRVDDWATLASAWWRQLSPFPHLLETPRSPSAFLFPSSNRLGASTDSCFTPPFPSQEYIDINQQGLGFGGSGMEYELDVEACKGSHPRPEECVGGWGGFGHVGGERTD